MAAIAQRVYASFGDVSIHSRFCETLIICAYIRIFRAENCDAAKFDSHLEFVILDRSNKNRHLDFDNAAYFYRTRRNQLESDMWQLCK